jgi:hypothetical protein
MGGKLVVGVIDPQVAGMGCEGAYVLAGNTIDMARRPEASGGNDNGACCGAYAPVA